MGGRLPIVTALLGAAVATGCAGQEPVARGGVERTTLAASSVGRPLTVAEGVTHDADVAVDRRTGRIFVAWAADRPDRNEVTKVARQDLWVASSDDDGRTWTDRVRVNDEAGTVYAGFNAQPRIAVSGRDRLLVLWPRARKGEAAPPSTTS